jgi:release factor glutamine methyltransferase
MSEVKPLAAELRAESAPTRPYEMAGANLWQWRHQALATALAQPTTGSNPSHAPNWQRELDWLLQALSDLDALALRLDTYRHRPQIPLQISPAHLDSLWQQRLQQRVPLQYLVGETGWRDLKLQVNPSVLIPRPETEVLIDLAVSAFAQMSQTDLPPNAEIHWADLGTGSGAIAIALALAFPQASIHAVDTSPAALETARQNVAAYQLDQRIQLYLGHWFEPLAALTGMLTGVIANPPYIPTEMLSGLQPEVGQHEPSLALDGGADGLVSLRQIIQTAPVYLRPGGILLLEMMQGQATTVGHLCEQTGHYRNTQIFDDLAGISRFAQAFRQ